MSNNPNGTDGPKVKIKASCFDCRHCKSTGYAVQGDSGHAVSCSLVDKRIGDTTWDTPTWCPLLAAAVDAANGTCDARAEIARLTVELAAARAVTTGVCRYLDCAASDLLAVVTSLYETRARAISDATAARGTVGGLLATEPVGSIVEFFDGQISCWYQVRIPETGFIDSRAYRRRAWGQWRPGCNISGDIRADARLVPADQADADPAMRGEG